MPNDEQPESLIDGEVVERIDRRELKPLFDTNHEHVFEPDSSDETDYYQAEMCSVDSCGLGRLVAK